MSPDDLANYIARVDQKVTNLEIANEQIKNALATLTDNLKEIQKMLTQYNALDAGVKGFKIDLKTLQDKLVMVDSNFDKRIAKLEVKPEAKVEIPKKKKWFEI